MDNFANAINEWFPERHQYRLFLLLRPYHWIFIVSCFLGARNIIFSENFANVINEWCPERHQHCLNFTSMSLSLSFKFFFFFLEFAPPQIAQFFSLVITNILHIIIIFIFSNNSIKFHQGKLKCKFYMAYYIHPANSQVEIQDIVGKTRT